MQAITRRPAALKDTDKPPEIESPQPAADADELEIASFEEQLRQRAPRLHVLPVLVAANVLVLAVFCAFEGGWLSPRPDRLIAWGSNYGPLALGDQAWRLLTGTFLHAGIGHLGVNVLSLWAIGQYAERLYGARLFAALYVLSALAGSVASLMWDPFINSVGASGVVMGIIGATLTCMADGTRKVPLSVFKEHAASLGSFALYSMFAVYAEAPVDHAAHIGGLVMGILAGSLLGCCSGPRVRLQKAAILGLCALLVAGLLAWDRHRLAYEAHVNFSSEVNLLQYSEQDTNQRLVLAMKTRTSSESREEFERLAGWWGHKRELYESLYLPADSPRIELRALLIEHALARQAALQALARTPQTLAEYGRLEQVANELLVRIKAKLEQRPRPEDGN